MKNIYRFLFIQEILWSAMYFNPRYGDLNDDITLFALVDFNSSYGHHLYEGSEQLAKSKGNVTSNLVRLYKTL